MLIDKPKRLSLLAPMRVALMGVALCAFAWTAMGIYLYWNDAKLVNFLAAWIPFVLSVLIAFVPERELSPRTKWTWRSSVIAAGFIWSVVLWHQQVVAERDLISTQTNLVNSAVRQSNSHSDEALGKLRSEVTGVRTDLKATSRDLSDLLSRTEHDLNSSISKVGKAEPPERASLVASLWSEKAQSYPIRKLEVSANADGVFAVPLFFHNPSGTAFVDGDIWIQVCGGCQFVNEPEGFDRPAGMPESTRHRIVHLLNPETAFEKTTLMIRTKWLTRSFQIGFRYACQACGAGTTKFQILTVENPIALNIGGTGDMTSSIIKIPQ